MSPFENLHTQRPGDRDTGDYGSRNNSGIQDFLHEVYAIPDRFKINKKPQPAVLNSFLDKGEARTSSAGTRSLTNDLVSQSGQVAQGIVDGTQQVASGIADLSLLIGNTILEGASLPERQASSQPILLLIRRKPAPMRPTLANKAAKPWCPPPE